MKSGWLFRVASVLVVASAVGLAVWLGTGHFEASGESSVPIAPVREGEFVVIIPSRGVIRADRSAQIYAPLVPNLRIAWMAPEGELIGEGNPIIRFDSTSARQELIQNQSALAQAEATLAQAIAEGRITAEHDAADLADARFEVELAELRTSGNEFASRIEAEQNLIDLRVARQNLRTLEAEVAEHVVSGEANVAALARQRDGAAAALELTGASLEQMEILAPLTGYPIFATNSTQLLQSNPQPYRVGDNVSGGMTLAELPDMTTLVMDVTVEEIERGRMSVGDEVIVRVDALPELTIETTLSGISPLAEFSLDTFGSSFHVYAALDSNLDPRLRPGMNGSMDVVVRRIPDAIAIPAQALFTEGGKPTVFLVEDQGYRLAEVQVLARNPDEVAVSGIPGDARVTLIDPQSGSSVEDRQESIQR